MKQSVNVLMIGPSRNAPGGIATVVNQYYEAGMDKKVNIKYIATTCSANKVIKLFEFLFSMIVFYRNINRTDLVHIHMASRGSYARKRVFVRWAKRKKKKIIIHLHGGGFRQFYQDECSDKKKEDIRKTFLMADKVIALSEEWSRFLGDLVQNDRISVIHNSIMVPMNFKKDYSNKNILFLGRLEKGKGVYDLVNVFPEIVEKYPDAKLFLAGDGEIEQVKTVCEMAGIIDNVAFLGWIKGKEKEKYLKKCSTFVLPSYYEGMPMSLLEAMSYGCAVLATDVGGIPQVIKHDYNGIIIESGKQEQLKRGLLKLLQYEEIRERLGTAAQKQIDLNFNLEKTIITIVELYESLVGPNS